LHPLRRRGYRLFDLPSRLSRIVLERLDSRYVVTVRETFYESDILLTPYSGDETIDANALGAFIRKQYEYAKVQPEEIDTGALILTGVAVRRKNARAIAELSRRKPQARRRQRRRQSRNRDGRLWLRGGRPFSARKGRVMNIDVGGGTSKIAVCADGKVTDVTAIDVGARLVVTDTRADHAHGRSGRQFAAELGLNLASGIVEPSDARTLAQR